MNLYIRILVPIEQGPCSARAIKEAIALANASHGVVRFVHVADDAYTAISYTASSHEAAHVQALIEAAGERLVHAAEQTARVAGIRASSAVLNRTSAIADSLMAESDRFRADLILMGTHGRHGAARAALGSIAEAVSRRSSVPVMLVRSVATDPANLRGLDRERLVSALRLGCHTT